MVSLNDIMLIGNVGNDPKMRMSPNGKSVVSFNMAVSNTISTKDGERQQETEWFTVVTWGRLAETCNQFLTKGRRVYVDGRLHSSTWEGQDGQRRFRNEVVANRVIFLDRQGLPQQSDGAQPPEMEAEGE